MLGYRLVGGLGAAIYDEGHRGRVAFATVAIAPDRSLSLVGLEDVDTGTVVWAYADAGYADDGARRTAGGAATAVSVVGPAGGRRDAGGVGRGPRRGDHLADGHRHRSGDCRGPVADELRLIVDEAVAALTA